MDVNEYIVKKLKSIATNFKGITLKYAFDAITDYHIIEVSPESIRRGCVDYMEQENDLWVEFFTLFPNKDILISEICKSNDMTAVIYDSSLDYPVVAETVAYTGKFLYQYNFQDNSIEAGIHNYALAA